MGTRQGLLVRIVRSRLFTVLAVGAMAVGALMLLQPTAMTALHAHEQNKALATYDRAVAHMDDDARETARAEARAYNDALPDNAARFMLSEQDEAAYREVLDPAESGVMGALVIDALGLTLPIYHGTSDAEMLKGACHVEGTALPVGEPSTHAAITAHRGEPGASYFKDLDRLAVGDTFEVSVLGQLTTYEVDRVSVVEPDDLGALDCEKGQAYCTLITCTPYGVNSHRLLVRGRVTDVREAR